jgi:hypothetical protein
MGQIDVGGFDNAVNNGASTSTQEIGYYDGNDTLIGAINSNPKILQGSVFENPVNGQIPDPNESYPELRAGGNGNISRMDINIGGSRLMRLDENDPGTNMPQSFQTYDLLDPSPGYIECGSQGLANALAYGLGSYEYELRDSSDNLYTQISPGDAAHVPITYTGGSTPVTFDIGSNLEFENTSGGTWGDIQKIIVRRTGANAGILFSYSNFDVSLPDGGRLIWTTLRLNVDF